MSRPTRLPAMRPVTRGASREPRPPEHSEPRVPPSPPPRRDESSSGGGGETPPPPFDVMVGATHRTPQYGVLGKTKEGQRVALDLNGCAVISLFGVQGSGKSYTLGAIAEMAALGVPRVSKLETPLGVVFFHYHQSDAYEPEHARATEPNDNPSEVVRLYREYGAAPAGLSDVVILTPSELLEKRRAEFPSIEVLPLKFGPSEIGAAGWRFLLGAVGNSSLYVRQIVAIMRKLRDSLSPQTLREEIKRAELKDEIQKLAEDRIKLAEPYIDDDARLGDLMRPGRTIIVDLRDEWLDKDDALGLFVVMLHIFGKVQHNGAPMNKLVVFDEAHKYISDSSLIGEVVETIRQVRHEATTVVIASQDPMSVPRAVIELTSVLVLHRMTSPAWLKHLKSAIAPLSKVRVDDLQTMVPGEALVWARTSSSEKFQLAPQRVTVRPRFSRHGGGTQTAVK